MSASPTPGPGPRAQASTTPRPAPTAPGAARSVESIEQLDAALRVVSVPRWVFLAVLGLAAAAFVAFACLYRAPLKVDGRGIILEARAGAAGAGEDDPLVQVTAPAAGRLTRVYVRIGESVRVNQLLAEIDQSELKDQIREAEADLDRLREEDRRLTAFDEEEAASRAHALGELERSLRHNLALDRVRQVIGRQIAEADRRLLLKGMLSNSDALKSRAEADAVESAVAANEARLFELAYERLQDQTTRRRDQLKRGLAVLAAETRLDLLRQRLKRDTEVRSAYAGEVVDLMITPHALIEKGAPAALLQPERRPEDAPLEAIVFVPAGQGKKVRLGDDVEISPDTVRRPEHGYVLGRVRSVSEIPATELAMLAELKHKTLVSSFIGQYAGQVLLSIRVDLPDAPPGVVPGRRGARRNRLRWSSATGAFQRVDTGTLCSASVVVERRPLIALAVPWVKEMVGIY